MKYKIVLLLFSCSLGISYAQQKPIKKKEGSIKIRKKKTTPVYHNPLPNNDIGY